MKLFIANCLFLLIQTLSVISEFHLIGRCVELYEVVLSSFASVNFGYVVRYVQPTTASPLRKLQGFQSSSFAQPNVEASTLASCRNAVKMYAAAPVPSLWESLITSSDFNTIGWETLNQQIVIHFPKVASWYQALGPFSHSSSAVEGSNMNNVVRYFGFLRIL
jgi:hypothetical protein